ncbi:nuclear transport factor 2 family protein [Pantoea sp. B65]|uniref:nuclear transport factor 2 family protein n=1 Tax=Pantoea sp. B65 TaxID=2813359 RepID=UPI0039B40686
MSVITPVEKQFIAYNAHDLEAFLACFSEDFTAWRMPADAPSSTGKAALREFYANHRFNNPALRAEVLSRTVLGNKVFDHELIYGINEQPIESIAIFAVENQLITDAWFWFA